MQPGTIASVPGMTAARRVTPSGAQPVDLSSSRRVPLLMEMVGELSRATDPRQVLRAFADGLLKLEGPRGYVSLSTRGLAPGEYKITRMHTGDGPMDVDASDPWKNWNSMATHRGGLFGEVIRQAWPQLIHHLYLKNDPAVGDRLAQYGSMMAIPLFENGEPLNWSITFRDDPEGFSIRELEDSILRANLGGATVRNVMITKQLREAHGRIQAEVEQIAAIQRALLPQSLPQLPGISIAAKYDAFDTAGGDMYDVRVLHERIPAFGEGMQEILSMGIADAAGHGPAAAVVTAMLSAILHARPATTEGPAAILEFANKHLCEKGLDGMFVTAFVGAIHPPTRTLVYARAGHNPPLIKNAGSGGDVRRLDDIGGIPLGVLPDATYESGTVVLEPGQTLVMYTDGIPESMNPRREMFGVRGIEEALLKCSGEPDCVINSISTAMKAHEAGQRQGDDQTMLAVKIER